MKMIKLTTGFSDCITMLKENNFRPFIRPLIVLVIASGFAWFLHDTTSSQIMDTKKKAEAQAAELENREDYLKNKAKYFKLAEVLPPNTKKPEWHQSQIISIREQLNLPEGSLRYANEAQSADGVFTISTVPISAELTFEQLGRVIEAIENYPEFLRVSNLKVSRKPGELEKLSVNFNTNTVFVQDKDFPDLIGGKK